jgi:hypothetical protein
MTYSRALYYNKSDVAIELCDRMVWESKFEPIFVFSVNHAAWSPRAGVRIPQPDVHRQLTNTGIHGTNC